MTKMQETEMPAIAEQKAPATARRPFWLGLGGGAVIALILLVLAVGGVKA